MPGGFMSSATQIWQFFGILVRDSSSWARLSASDACGQQYHPVSKGLHDFISIFTYTVSHCISAGWYLVLTRSLLIAINTPPPLCPFSLSLRYIVKPGGKISLSFTLFVSHDSVPVTTSQPILSRIEANAPRILRTDWQFMLSILVGLHLGAIIGGYGVVESGTSLSVENWERARDCYSRLHL